MLVPCLENDETEKWFPIAKRTEANNGFKLLFEFLYILFNGRLETSKIRRCKLQYVGEKHSCARSQER